MTFNECQKTIAKIESYPRAARLKLLELKSLIKSVANSTPEVTCLTESLKWGQPSYLSNCGTAVRFDWSAKTADKVHVYVNCQTLLVEVYREIFGDFLVFVGNREIELDLYRKLPISALSKCFELALKYQKVKRLPMLGC